MAHSLTKADQEIHECLQNAKSFAVIAGAGSGKTTSLINALNFVRQKQGKRLRRDGQKVACITYTKRARDVIEERLSFDNLFEVSTIHSFLWAQIARYAKDIREVLTETLIPAQIEKQYEKGTSGNSQRAKKARQRISDLNDAIEHLGSISKFAYNDSQYSDFINGQIGHDDVIELASHLICSKPLLRRIVGQQFPYMFVDEAQDTFLAVVDAFNAICESDGLPIVGYFGDPMQQIYEEGVGEFVGPAGYVPIDKEQNFRSGTSIIKLANALRDDIEQIPGDNNANETGNVRLILVEAEAPEGSHNRYSDAQLDRALLRFDQALDQLEWIDHGNSKRLYLVRQMIARRLGFLDLHRQFNGVFASSRTEDEFRNGTNFLVKPFVDVLCPVIQAVKDGNSKKLLDVLRDTSPAFGVNGENRQRSLKDVLKLAEKLVAELKEIWDTQTIRDVLEYARSNNLCRISERLEVHLDRPAREEDYDPEQDEMDKIDWLADAYFAMDTQGLLEYSNFVSDGTPFSTQHGVKGEEYEDVLVVFDDVEAGWHWYSFTKLLVPSVAGNGTEGQLRRSKKLAYVCFTRARQNLNIVLFCPNPNAAKNELIGEHLFQADQVEILTV